MRQVATITALSAATNTAVNALRLLLTLHAIALGAGPFLVGVMNALYFLLPSFISVSLGRWMDRRGYMPGLVLSCIAPIAVAVACFAMPNLAMLSVGMVVTGAAYMATGLALNSAAALAGRPEERVSNFAWLTIGLSLGNMFGPAAAGFGIDGIGHRATYLAIAAFDLAVLAAIHASRGRMPAAARVAGTANRRIGDLLKLPGLRRVIIIGIVVSVCWDAYSFLLPLYGVERGLSASTIGSVMAAFGVGTLVSRLAMPALARRLSQWLLLSATFVLCGLGYLLLPFTGDATLVTAISFMVGLGLGLSSPIMIALLYSASPPGRQMEVVGLRSTFANAIHVGLPLGAGALGAALGIPAVIWTVGAPVLAASGLAWRWRDRRGNATRL